MSCYLIEMWSIAIFGINFWYGFTAKMFEFDPPNAKDYEWDEAELFRTLHAEFVIKGFTKMPKGMTGLDSG